MRVQFVSKPIAPPFRDGTKCLVRDLCLHFKEAEPSVLGVRGQEALQNDLGPRAKVRPIYSTGGSYQPGLTQNLKAAAWLALSRGADIWHFVFAPNPRSSQVGRALRSLRGVPTVQTVASPPRSFSSPAKLLFGDVVAVQSEWTRAQFLDAYASAKTEAPRIEVIFPPAPDVPTPSDAAVAALRQKYAARHDGPLFLYPGDLEVSQGATTTIEIARALRETMPNARVVAAYRDKTNRAKDRADELEKQCDGIVRFERNVADIHALVAASTAVLFPVDDLYGKVDLPIVLLEAMRLGTPVLALNQGPLKDLDGALLLGPAPGDWAEALSGLVSETGVREARVAKGQAAVLATYAPDAIAGQYEALYRGLLAAR